MKVKVLCRNPDDYMRETKRDIFKVPRNYNPDMHLLEAPREYTRALNAVKLERVFAKPFVCNLDGHREGVSCLSKHTDRLSLIASGAYDGEVCLWNLPTRSCTRRFQAHSGFVRGTVFTADGNRLLTVGDDKTVKMWNTDSLSDEVEEPVETLLSKTVLLGISHHSQKDMYATGGEVCQLWEESRNTPIKVFRWGVDSLTDICFNAIDGEILAACSNDRSIIIYDTRDTGPVRKVVLKLRANKLCWNPMEAFMFTVANEDYNLYTFDMRMLRSAVYVHVDHTAAVTSIDYAPTGREFVSGSYDKSIRIFESDKRHSRDIYHTKRMQHVTCVVWSLDNKYILNGSDEMNIRVWKGKASEKLGTLKPRERTAFNYNEVLKEKFAMHPQIKRIARHRNIPRHIYHAKNEHRIIREKELRKQRNRIKHSKPGSVKNETDRKKIILEEKE